MTRQKPLELALEALKLAAECGGENDLDIYLKAKQALEEVMQAVLSYDAGMNSAERPPEGEDYNRLLAILEIQH